MVLLAFRVAWIQVVDADELTEKAIDQQTSDIPIAAKRGVIYDRNGKELATSVACYSVWVRPAELAENKTDEEITAAASDLATVLNMEAEEVKTKLTKKQALVKVAQYLEKDTADQVRDLEITGISLSEDTRRYYPLGNFASQLLGSVTVDNTGRTGIELEYDQYLSGVSGRDVYKRQTLDYAGIIIEAYVAYISIPVQDIAVGMFYLAYLFFCVGQLLLCSFQFRSAIFYLGPPLSYFFFCGR